MTIETKFKVGQEVWLISQSKAESKTINNIHIDIYTEGGKEKIEIFYDLKVTPGSHSESLLFPSKEALLQSL